MGLLTVWAATDETWVLKVGLLTVAITTGHVVTTVLAVLTSCSSVVATVLAILAGHVITTAGHLYLLLRFYVRSRKLLTKESTIAKSRALASISVAPL